MIRIATIADLNEHSYQLGLYCLPCNRWQVADLDKLIKSGKGDATIAGTRFRCEDCGQVAQKQIRPPVPDQGNAHLTAA